jgi:hypothetical protein
VAVICLSPKKTEYVFIVDRIKELIKVEVYITQRAVLPSRRSSLLTYILLGHISYPY